MNMIHADYRYLKGDEVYWKVKGAAFNLISEDCQECGWGTFGNPTPAGQRVIDTYEATYPDGKDITDPSYEA